MLFPIIPLCCLSPCILFVLFDVSHLGVFHHYHYISLSLYLVYHHHFILSPSMLLGIVLGPNMSSPCLLSFPFLHFVSHPLHLASHYPFMLSPIILSLPVFFWPCAECGQFFLTFVAVGLQSWVKSYLKNTSHRFFWSTLFRRVRWGATARVRKDGLRGGSLPWFTVRELGALVVKTLHSKGLWVQKSTWLIGG